jgi:hypothetical protein
MGKPAFTRASLSNVRVIMAIIRVPVVELLCQAVMRRIPVLKYLLSGARGRPWPYSVVPGIKCCRFQRFRFRWSLPGTKSP